MTSIYAYVPDGITPGNPGTRRVLTGVGMLARAFDPKWNVEIQSATNPDEQRINAQRRSEDITDTTYWTASDATLAANSTAAPDGTTTADKVTENTANAMHGYFTAVANPIAVSAGQVVAASLHMKAGTKTKAELWFSNAGNGFRVRVDLLTGAIISSGATGTGSFVYAEVLPVVNGWYRVCAAGTCAPAATSVFLNPLAVKDDGTTETYVGDGASFFYVWGHQVEVGASLCSGYMRTTSAAVRRRQNAVIRSEELDDAQWTKNSVTISANAIAAPDGTVSGDKIVEAATNSGHNVVTTTSYACGDDDEIAVSAYVKPAERFWCEVIAVSGSDSFQARVNLLTQTVTTVVTGTGSVTGAVLIRAAPNGWFRVSVVGKLGGGHTVVLAEISVDDGTHAAYLGDVTKGLYAWGVQLDVGMPTVGPYVKTAGTGAAGTGAEWATITTLAPPTGTDSRSDGSYLDELPLDGARRWYRARNTDGTAGARRGTSIVAAGRVGPWLAARPAFGRPAAISQVPSYALAGAVVPSFSPAAPMRDQAFDDGTYAVQAVGSDGLATHPSIKTSSRYRCYAYVSSSITITNYGGTPQYAALDAEIFDVGDLHDNATNNSRVTIPATNYLGTWIITAFAEWAANATGRRMIELRLNGSAQGARQQRGVVSGANVESQELVWVFTDPTPGDYWQLNMEQTSGGNLTATAGIIIVHLW